MAEKKVEDKQLEAIGKEVVTKKRGRPVGSGGNKRADLSWDGNKNVEPGDRGRYLRHAMASWDLPVLDLDDAKQVEERVNWYFNLCCTDDIKPTVSGLANALGIDRKTLYRWSIGEVRENTHSHIIKKAYRAIENLTEQFMTDGKINPVVGIFLAKNHFGYKDQQDVIVTPNNPLGDNRSESELREQYIEAIVVEE